jgi:DNA-binding PadR family transcriptional regulator
VGGTLDKLVQPAILAVLVEGPTHGYRLVERIGAMPSFAGHTPDASGVYRLLKAMESRELVTFTWDTSRAGPAKRTYQITPKGQQCLRSWVQTLEDYREKVASLLKTTRAAANKCG